MSDRPRRDLLADNISSEFDKRDLFRHRITANHIIMQLWIITRHVSPGVVHSNKGCGCTRFLLHMHKDISDSLPKRAGGIIRNSGLSPKQ